MKARLPPLLARILLRLTPAALRRPDIVDELNELFEVRTRAFGPRIARERYARDVLSLWLHSDTPKPTWGTRMERLVMDVRYAVRRLRATPTVSAIAIATVALAVGANTAIFSVTDAALMRRPPFPQPDRVVKVFETSADRPGSLYSVSYPTLSAWRERHDLVAALSTFKGGSATVMERDPEQAGVSLVSLDYFAVYGVRPLVGRVFEAADMLAGSPPVVVLSHAFWQKYFTGSVDVIGRPLHLADGTPTIIGVLPPDVPFSTPLYRPLQPSAAAASPRARQYGVTARLQPGITIEQAQAEFQAISRRMPDDGERGSIGVRVEPYAEGTARYARPTLRILTAAVAFILLIACVNVAGLLFARGATRGRELALRASLGARRGRLVMQLLVESCMVSLLGGALGVALAWIGLDALIKAIPLSLPATARPEIDLRVLGFTLGLSLATGVMFGLPPAWRFSRANLVASLGSGSRTATPISRRVTGILIAIEIALTLVLVSGAALMLRSLSNLYGVDKGFSPAGVITLEATPLQNDDETYRRYYAALLERIRALPGVEAAGAADTFPLGPSRAMSMASAVGITAPTPKGIVVTSVMPGFFDAMRIPVRAGRVLGSEDRTGTPATAVLNERAARAFFQGASPIGRQMTLGNDTLEIVGVVADLRSKDLGSDPEPEIYRAYAQSKAGTSLEGRAVGRRLALIVRTAGDRRAVATTLREQAHAVGHRALVQRVRTFDDWIDDSARLTQQRTTLLTLLGSLGLLLALIGVFGMTSYAVSQRTREIGVRVALGATTRDVLTAVGGSASAAIAIGVIVGAGATLWAGRAIASFLYNVTPWDPISLAAAALTLAVAAALAAYLPARRALRVDPVNALREE